MFDCCKCCLLTGIDPNQTLKQRFDKMPLKLYGSVVWPLESLLCPLYQMTDSFPLSHPIKANVTEHQRYIERIGHQYYG